MAYRAPAHLVKLTPAGLSMLICQIDEEEAYILLFQLPVNPIFGYSNSQLLECLTTSTSNNFNAELPQADVRHRYGLERLRRALGID